jgi:formyltetrahydrofolate deformylase
MSERSPQRPARNSAILLVECPDRKGIVAAIAAFVLRYDGNILHADQHQAAELGLFLCRVEWDLDGFRMDLDKFPVLFAPIAKEFRMRWRLAFSGPRPPVAILVSKHDHCLADLLYRWHEGELACDVPLILSNHPDAQRHADFYGIPFHVVPVTQHNKAEAERKQLELLRAAKIELVVLARYMQILSPDFIRHFPQRIINIHHSFLPAFAGAKPHHQAFTRGVKLIGATAHYVTEQLDEGPIIEQDVARISRRDGVDDLIRKGRDLEKVVLSRAVRWHLENRVLIFGRKTVIFD